MKKFTKKIIYFILPILISATVLDKGISYLLSQAKEEPGNFEVWSDVYKENSNANSDIAIHGSSRSWVHINPKIISDSLHLTSYNFGMDGHNLWLQYLRHLELLKNHKKPKIIIFSVDAFTLQKRPDLYQSNQYLPYMLWNENIIKYTSSYVGYTATDYYIPLMRYAGQTEAVKSALKVLINRGQQTNYRTNGYRGIDEQWSSDFDKAKENLKYYEIKVDPNSAKLFENFIKQCKVKNIELIFVYTPEYIEGQKFVKNRKNIIDIYQNLSEKYRVPFYNYSNDSICLDKSYFYNASHLNKKGSELFSKKFAHDLKSRAEK